MVDQTPKQRAEAARRHAEAGIFDCWTDAATLDEVAAAVGLTPEDLAAAEAELDRATPPAPSGPPPSKPRSA
jgi:hypothetical protein